MYAEKVQSASTQQEASIVAANLAIPVIHSQCVHQWRRTFVKILDAVSAERRYSAHQGLPVSEELARISALKLTVVHELRVIQENVSALRVTQAIRRICEVDVYQKVSAITMQIVKAKIFASNSVRECGNVLTPVANCNAARMLSVYRMTIDRPASAPVAITAIRAI